MTDIVTDAGADVADEKNPEVEKLLKEWDLRGSRMPETFQEFREPDTFSIEKVEGDNKFQVMAQSGEECNEANGKEALLRVVQDSSEFREFLESNGLLKDFASGAVRIKDLVTVVSLEIPESRPREGDFFVWQVEGRVSLNPEGVESVTKTSPNHFEVRAQSNRECSPESGEKALLAALRQSQEIKVYLELLRQSPELKEYLKTDPKKGEIDFRDLAEVARDLAEVTEVNIPELDPSYHGYREWEARGTVVLKSFAAVLESYTTLARAK